MVPAAAIARWFVAQLASQGECLTQIKLQKLLYLAHGWHLALYDQPLLAEDVEARSWGPYCRTVGQVYGLHGRDPLPMETSSPFLPQLSEFLQRIWAVHKVYTALELSALVTGDGSPWDLVAKSVTREQLEEGVPIPNHLIRRHYRRLAQPSPPEDLAV